MIKRNLNRLKNLIFKFQNRNRTTPAFIHIPKTGGSYLRQMESDFVPVIWPIKALGHSYFIHSDHPVNISDRNFSGIIKTGFLDFSLYSNDIFFSVVRNPFDILVSWADHAGGWSGKKVNPNQYDYQIANKGFDYFLKSMAERTDYWPNKKLIHFQLFNSKGDFLPDWICRTESLDQDLSQMAAYFDLSYIKKSKQRVSTARNKDYRTHYTDELREIVEKTWSRELDFLGYNFDGVDLSKSDYYGKISEQNKSKIKYNLNLDQLIIKV